MLILHNISIFNRAITKIQRKNATDSKCLIFQFETNYHNNISIFNRAISNVQHRNAIDFKDLRLESNTLKAVY